LTETPAHRRHHLERLRREREAREQRKVYRAEQRAAAPHKTCTGCKMPLPLSAFSVRKSTGKTIARCKPCVSAEALAHYYAKTGRKVGDLSRKAARRAVVSATWAAYHSLRLEGFIPSDPVTDEEDWELTSRAVREGWERSGDKLCARCNQTVLPSAMLPPGPGNFYPHHCRPCAGEAWRDGYVRVFGHRPPERPRAVILRDGSEITIGELARRHRQREALRRSYTQPYVSL